jgi:alkylation response protein AidB-like acyl-CoA dehydrogenase
MTTTYTPVVDNADRALLVDTVRSFVANEIKPKVVDLDATERFPEEIYRQLGALGLFGVTLPVDHYGAGGSVRDYIAVMEELAYGYASIADQAGLVELLGSLISKFGSAEQRDRYLPGLLAGTTYGAYALTEPNAGSDLGGVATTAVRVDGGWRLTGEKIYIHNAPVAHFALVLAVTDRSKRKRGGMSMFLVDIDDTPGATRAYHEHKMGQRASQVGGFVFEDAFVPDGAVLGAEGTGFGAVLQVLEKGRLGIGALANGISRAALDTATEHARNRQQFGQRIADFQAIAFTLADMATDYEAARQLLDHGARLLDEGRDANAACSMAKLFASEASIRNTSRAVQVLGGSGYIRGVEAERLYRDARITTIYEGTSEVQRIIVSRAVIG